MKRLMRAFRRDNRGSGIVTVLVALLFLVALGATTLFLSYTGLQINASERKSKENFYSADAAMQQVRTGVGQAVDESLKTAYDALLKNYSVDNEEYQEKVRTGGDLWGSLNEFMKSKFQNEFQADLLGWKDSGGGPLFAEQGADSGVYAYSPAVLLGFLNYGGARKEIDEAHGIYRLTAASATVDLKCGDPSVTIAYDKDNIPSLTLSGITLEYTAGSGYKTDITTGITIRYPLFSYSPAAYSVADVAQCAMIAKSGLACTSPKVLKLTGDAYAGAISIDNGAALYHPQGTLVSGGDVKVDNSSKFRDDAPPSDSPSTGTASLWAKRITVGDSAAVSLIGSAYVADDLTLAGKNAQAVLSGRYYGFGYSLTDASASSSILINGRDARLDLQGLTSLMLAGSSFIDAAGASVSLPSGGETDAGKYIMGQSVAARSDQLAYLVPASCLPDGISSNPCIRTSAIDDSLLTGSVMSRVKTLEAENPCFQYVDGVQAVYVHLNSTGGSEMAAYLFFTFRQNGSQSPQYRANQYFKDYYSRHSGDLNGYLTKYLSYYRAAAAVQSGGNTYAGSVTDGAASGSSLAGPSADPLSGPATQYMTQYANLCQTMSEGVSAGDAPSPYEYVVNAAAIGRLPDGTTEFKDQSGKTVAVIVRNAAEAFKLSDALGKWPDLKVVVATGDVSADQEFSGLIVSGGTVAMSESIQASTDVPAALQAVIGTGDADAAGKTLLSFLNIGSKTEGGSGGGAGTSWDSLVGYSGWQKH